jgi:hypothetical protein
MSLSATIATALSLSKKAPFVITSFNVWARDLGEETFFDPTRLYANPNFAGPAIRLDWSRWIPQRIYLLDYLPEKKSMSVNASTKAVKFGKKGTL